MTSHHGARAAVFLGLAVSLAGNAMAAEPTLLGRVVAGWAPLALALAVVLLEHGEPPEGSWRAATWLATGVLAAVAAWASYWHLVELAHSVSENVHGTQYLLPLTPDALVLIGSAYLRQPTRAKAEAPVLPGPPPMPPQPEAPTEPAEPLELPAPEPTNVVVPPAPEPARAQTKTELVRQLVLEHPDWTQAQLAEAAECDVRTVRRALKGATDLDAELAELFAEPSTNSTEHSGAHA